MRKFEHYDNKLHQKQMSHSMRNLNITIINYAKSIMVGRSVFLYRRERMIEGRERKRLR